MTGLGYDPNGTPGQRFARRSPRAHRLGQGRPRRRPQGLQLRRPRQGTSCAQIKCDYNGQQAGYTADPQELINYVEAHDNETLFDAIQLKAPVATSMADRVRMQVVGLSLVLLGEGVPFVHAGSEILRSKSLDRNCYNSGDWFNRLDFTYSSNNWGVGLPPASSNQSNWPFMKPLLANPALRPTSDDIRSSLRRFRDLLQIRKGSPLFRLRTAAQVDARLSFANGGPDQIPGLIVMRLSDRVDPDLDPNAEEIIVFFNANDEDETLKLPDTRGRHFKLSKIQRTSDDEIVTESRFSSGNGTFFVPRRTTAVFVDQ